MYFPKTVIISLSLLIGVCPLWKIEGGTKNRYISDKGERKPIPNQRVFRRTTYYHFIVVLFYSIRYFFFFLIKAESTMFCIRVRNLFITSEFFSDPHKFQSHKYLFHTKLKYNNFTLICYSTYIFFFKCAAILQSIVYMCIYMSIFKTDWVEVFFDVMTFFFLLCLFS